ncbi:hypothetical protein CEXT_643841 [Caerostris extrusa]|uniref:Uncharacterized protein n=1 Tax=Caerostris extrusa TaxID=172846 RepID=A0AAV4NKJ9_CAEEX|nr:hypothetical protein CEXT_643841 [Caerostris extrusa]
MSENVDLTVSPVKEIFHKNDSTNVKKSPKRKTNKKTRVSKNNNKNAFHLANSSMEKESISKKRIEMPEDTIPSTVEDNVDECESVEKELTKEQAIESENVFEESVVLSNELEQDHSSDINSVKQSRVVNEIPENNDDNFTALNEPIHKSDGSYRSKIQNKKNQNDDVNLFLDGNSLMNKNKTIHDGYVKENVTDFTENFKKSSILDERNCNLENRKGSTLCRI